MALFKTFGTNYVIVPQLQETTPIFIITLKDFWILRIDFGFD